MTYTWPTAFCCMFSVFLSFYPFLAVSIFAFFIWVNTLRNVYKRIEDEESRGITAHNTKDKKIQEQTYLQMTDEQKASFQASQKANGEYLDFCWAVLGLHLQLCLYYNF